MGKILKPLIAAVLVAVMLCSCGADSRSTTEETADQNFLNDLITGLEARWAWLDSDEYDDESTDDLKKAIEKELNVLSKYKDAKFEDSKLQEKAISYINSLNDQKEALFFEATDLDKANELWTEAYATRVKLLDEFINTYNLTVDEKYQDTLDNLLSNATAVKESEAEKKAVSDFLSTIEFEQTKNEYGYKTYSAIVKNTTGIDFEYFNLMINLLDKDGVILETQYSSLSNIAKNKKVKFEFSTDAEFASTELAAEWNS